MDCIDIKRTLKILRSESVAQWRQNLSIFENLVNFIPNFIFPGKCENFTRISKRPPDWVKFSLVAWLAKKKPITKGVIT